MPDDPAQQERVREKTRSRTRTRTAIDPSHWVNELLEFEMRFQTSNLAAQINTVTSTNIRSHSVPMKTETRTRDTTSKTDGKYERAPSQDQNHW